MTAAAANDVVAIELAVDLALERRRASGQYRIAPREDGQPSGVVAKQRMSPAATVMIPRPAPVPHFITAGRSSLPQIEKPREFPFQLLFVLTPIALAAAITLTLLYGN